MDKLKIEKATSSENNDNNLSDNYDEELGGNDEDPYRHAGIESIVKCCKNLSQGSKTQPNTLSKSLLVNRKYLEGIRGYLTILVIIDHFYYYNFDGNVERFQYMRLLLFKHCFSLLLFFIKITIIYFIAIFTIFILHIRLKLFLNCIYKLSIINKN